MTILLTIILLTGAFAWYVLSNSGTEQTPRITSEETRVPPFMEKALRGLPAGDELHRMACEYIAAGEPPKNVAGVLAHAISRGRHPRRSAVATWLLGRCNLDEQARAAVLSLVREMAGARMSLLEDFASGLTVSVLAVVVFGGLLAAAYDTPLPIFVLAAGCLAGLSLFGPLRRLNRAAAVDALGRLGGTDDLPLLAQLFKGGAPEVRAAAAGALQRLLAGVDENDYGRFGPTELSQLAALLPTGSPELDSRLLQALKAVGTPAIGSYLRRFMKRVQSPALAAQADDALRAVTARAERSQQISRLVRPVIGTVDGDQLLRPAVRGGDEESLVQSVGIPGEEGKDPS